MKKIKFEYRITIIYSIVGGMWILFSDKLLHLFIQDSNLLTKSQTYKGWIYVIVTAILFYSVLKKHLVKIRNAELKARENDRLKTAFLQNISHEIRTPMNGIIGFAELLNSTDLSDEQKSQYLEIITKNSNQLLKIVNDILDISLIETGNITAIENKVHLNKFLEGLYVTYQPMIREEVAFTLHKGLSDNLSIVLTDVVKIKQIMDNLISNAVKFTGKGHIKYGYTLKNDELEFFVEDTGIGIASHLHKDIFEHFHRVETEISRLYQGIGLGLAICKGNVELLKGKIWVKSELNKGSKFYFTIPYNPLP